ncbi:molecular chaperone DjlA [Gemmobacter lanyuensis]|uniref:Molecular chaperone DjlA n=1 Tax=Gemmobacter lanyuensis TaxID=1054497 RepID=A0A918MLI7_9RHOB|nr:molecular chaperone DjiA [Gemmobacter lanyuensis]GGW36038.1 molecular chaperone DjlA [Gemmobacter lanyuensis]
MSIWTRILEAISALAQGEGLTAVFDRLRTPPEACPERTVAFTIAVIALGAKMAKADGEVTRNEVSAFREVFHVPPEEEPHAARVFNLARQDVAGFDAYARKIRAMFQGDSRVLTDVLEGLFHVSVADGHYHPREDAFLAEVARIFGVGERCFRAIRARYVPEAPRDPYDVLGLPANASIEQARAAWKAAVRDSHPDRLIARGVPPEAVELAERRLIAVNAAWEEISAREAA